MQISVFILLAFALQMARNCEGGKETEPILECIEESDPMGAKYRGTTSHTWNGTECERWNSDDAMIDYEEDYDILFMDNNYCRNPIPSEESVKPWCYTKTWWAYCNIQACEHTEIKYGKKGCSSAVVTYVQSPADGSKDGEKWVRVDLGSDIKGFALSATSPTSTWEVAVWQLSGSESQTHPPNDRGCEPDKIFHASSASPEVKSSSSELFGKVRYIWFDLVPGCTYSIDSCY